MNKMNKYIVKIYAFGLLSCLSVWSFAQAVPANWHYSLALPTLVYRAVGNDISCASYDARNCLWGTAIADVVWANINPLECGAAHEAQWGKTGYHSPTHWCSLLRLRHVAAETVPVVKEYTGAIHTEGLTVNRSGLTQVSINTDTKVDDVALTVGGAVHIGPKNGQLHLFDYTDAISDYLLWVEKGIVTEDIVLVGISEWKDAVLKGNYDLKPLDEVLDFIKTNHHLPGVKSEQEVIDEGYTLQEINLALLEKVEELFLHTIEQDQAIRAHQDEAKGIIQDQRAITGKLMSQAADLDDLEQKHREIVGYFNAELGKERGE